MSLTSIRGVYLDRLGKEYQSPYGVHTFNHNEKLICRGFKTEDCGQLAEKGSEFCGYHRAKLEARNKKIMAKAMLIKLKKELIDVQKNS